MIQLGLIGYPLGHTLSPVIQEAAMKSCGVEGIYSLFPIMPDDDRGLTDLISRLRAEEIRGLNVTIPHKQKVIPLLDALTPTASAIGAVNTVFRRERKVVGENTDSPGFLADLKRQLFNQRFKISRRKSAIILGAGGSARAVVYALSKDGWQVTVVARRIDQAKSLAASFPNLKTAAKVSEVDLSSATLIVNATPVGMMPNIGQSPLPEKVNSHSGAFVYDLVYNPRETSLVKNARAQGLNATSGLGMLIEQAALSFEIWTGRNPPRDVLFEAVM